MTDQEKAEYLADLKQAIIDIHQPKRHLYRQPLRLRTLGEQNRDAIQRAFLMGVDLRMWRCMKCGKRYKVSIPEARENDATAYKIKSPCCATLMEITGSLL